MLNGSWEAYIARKVKDGRDPNCFSPEEIWEFDYLLNMIMADKPHLDQLTVTLAIREGTRRTMAPRPRQHFIELVMHNILERENQWSTLLENVRLDKNFPYRAN